MPRNRGTSDESQCRESLQALPPHIRLRVCLYIIGQAIPELVEEVVGRKLGLKVAELAPMPAPTMPTNYTERAISFIAGHPGATTAEVAASLAKTRQGTQNLLAQKQRDGILERRGHGWFIMA